MLDGIENWTVMPTRACLNILHNGAAQQSSCGLRYPPIFIESRMERSIMQTTFFTDLLIFFFCSTRSWKNWYIRNAI